MPKYVWDSSVNRYGTLSDDERQIQYDGSKDVVDVPDPSKLSEANMAASWLKGGLGSDGSLMEVLWNVGFRSGINVFWDKKPVFDQTVKDFTN